jgi:tetratricopeptide (TPR) repeat protein/DNA-binding XRE family transcriptional regulator
MASVSEQFLSGAEKFSTQTGKTCYTEKAKREEDTMHDKEQMNGHPLRVLRTQLDLSQKDFAAKVGVSEITISRAENGHRLSPKVRHQLCDRLGKTSEELGLMGRKREMICPVSPPQTIREHASYSQSISSQTVSRQPQPQQTTQTNNAPSISFFIKPSKDATVSIEALQEHERLTLGTNYLGQLFDNGWSTDEILDAVRIVLQGVGGTPSIKRQNLLVSRPDTMIRDIPTLISRRVSQEELAKLHHMLGESIAWGWKLFHSASNAQVLAVGQALLTLVRHNHAYLSSPIRTLYYSSVYNLIGIALHFQEQYHFALDMHINAHIAALATGDALYVVQSLTCQANAYQALGRYSEAIQTIEEALRILGDLPDMRYVRSKAHLLACFANHSIIVGDYITAQKHLEASEVFLTQIDPNEEFDTTSWLHLAGNFALATKNYSQAIRYFEKALSLPQTSNLRHATGSVALAAAYLYVDESASLTVAEQTASVIEVVKAPLVNKQLADYIQQGLLVTSPENKRVKTFVSDMQHRIPSLNRNIATL